MIWSNPGLWACWFLVFTLFWSLKVPIPRRRCCLTHQPVRLWTAEGTSLSGFWDILLAPKLEPDLFFLDHPTQFQGQCSSLQDQKSHDPNAINHSLLKAVRVHGEWLTEWHGYQKHSTIGCSRWVDTYILCAPDWEDIWRADKLK